MSADAAAGLPAGLRDRVLAAARAARPAGRPVRDAPPIPPAEAFARAADAFAALLESLDASDWRAPVLRDLDVQGLVGHLIGVERDVQRALAGDPTVADADHVGGTQAAAEAERGRPPELTRRAFREAADATLRAVGGPASGDGGYLAVHGMRLALGELLVVRAFELWTHENDIRAAAGRPPRVPDAATLRSMTGLAVAWLPHGVRRAAPDTARLDVHLVLTGPGGGTWDVTVGRDRPGAADGGLPGDTPPAPGVLVVAEAVDFCRLVADRASPDDVVRQVDGHVRDAAVVLAGARALALD